MVPILINLPCSLIKVIIRSATFISSVISTKKRKLDFRFGFESSVWNLTTLVMRSLIYGFQGLDLFHFGWLGVKLSWNESRKSRLLYVWLETYLKWNLSWCTACTLNNSSILVTCWSKQRIVIHVKKPLKIINCNWVWHFLLSWTHFSVSRHVRIFKKNNFYVLKQANKLLQIQYK